MSCLGGARKEFDELAQRVEKETVGLPAGQTPKAYADLKAENPDFVGWIKIEGTSVNYPVVQTKAEPQYYLRRSFEGSYSIAGTPFLDAQCDMEKGIGLIIYGHNMNDGTMFAVLKKMADPEFRQAHPIAVLQTAEGTHEYRILTAMTTDTTQLLFNRTQFSGDEDFLAFAGSMLAGTEIVPQKQDRLLTLVTCAYDWDGARTVVVAIEQE